MFFREKEENKEKMMSYLGSLLKQQVADEDFRIAKAVAKNEAKMAQEEYEKFMRAQKELKEINDYRLETIKRKEMEQMKKEREDEELMRKKVETDLMHQIYEAEKAKKRGVKLQEISEQNLKIHVNDYLKFRYVLMNWKIEWNFFFNLQKERKEKEKQVRQEDKEHVLKEMELLELEDDQFRDYATRVIDYMGKHGRNTYPMKKVLEYFFFLF